MTKIFYMLAMLRPKQWLKNLLLLFPPFFGGKLFVISQAHIIFLSLLAFSLAASCGYIINDILDRKSDVFHPLKKKRALVRGDISVRSAFLFAIILFNSSIGLSLLISTSFLGFLFFYLVVTLLYSIYFKHVVILDVFILSFGYLARVLAGGEAFQVDVSNWLFLTVFVVALFLATGKRLGEVAALGDRAFSQRNILAQYSPAYLEGMLWFSAAVAIVMYALYVIEHKNQLIYTMPIAAFGLLRYIYKAKNGNGEPTEVLLHDTQLMGAGIIWLLIIGATLYAKYL